ncbi:hypothetical protein ACFB49_42840 [Sphingomonas sp. DBB INV C78]|uniref:XRE family transcriptional regulator n=1 Tax=Sphingomonas sp. DBB INV C78 TaxID=3349434 RepID=UPI0036D2CDA4
MAEQTIGEHLIALKERSGLSLTDIAKRAGYAGKSSVQEYFRAHYNPPRLDAVVAQKLAKAFAGSGEPNIEASELLSLVGIPVPTEVVPIDSKMPTLRGSPKDVPVFGTALGVDLDVEDEDHHHVLVEQTMLSMTETITTVRRPPGAEGMRNIYALYVVGSSMIPRFHPGTAVFVDPIKPPSLGDDVIVQLRNGSGEITCALVKTLVRRTSKFVELQQYRPEVTFKVAVESIAAIHRVLTTNDMFGL